MMKKSFLKVLMAVLSMLALTMGQTMKAQTEQIYTGFTATAGTTGYNNQSYGNLVDGKFTSAYFSKWCLAMSNKTVLDGQTEAAVYCVFNTSRPIEVTKYILTTGEDNASCKNRNPKRWVLQAKQNTGDNWVTVDSVFNDTVLKDVNYENYEFTMENPGTYRYFRFLVYENQGDGSLQLGELRLKGPLQTATLSGAGTESNPFIIADLAGWNTFATNVNAGVNADKYYKLADSYDDMAVTMMVGTSDHPFTGHFNGNGKTLNVNISGTEQGVAPFSYINGATIEMLTVAGVVASTAHHAAGLVGMCKDDNANVIQYCNVETNVAGTTYSGGIIGHGGNGNLTLTNSVYSGTISAFTNFAGGLLGWCDNATVTMADCLFKGSFSAGTNGKYHPIACRYDAANPTATCTNVFYLGNDATAASKYCLSGANGLKVTSSMPSNTMCLIANAADGNSYYCATSVSGVESFYEVTGSVIHPVPTVKLPDGTTVGSSCYTVTYSGDETTPGTYSVTISGVSSEGYEGTTTINYEVTYQKPTNLTVSLTCADATKATISWTENGTATQWKVCLNGNESGAITVNTNPYTLTGLEAEHGYNVKVCAVRELGDSPWSDEVYFMPTDKVTVGTGNFTNAYLPFDDYYKYCLTQQIFTPDELESNVNAGKAILSIAFKSSRTPARNLDIYIVHTNKSSFSSSSDWIVPTSSDKVFSGEVSFGAESWTTITLDVPFVYDGTSNIAVIVDDNTGSFVSSSAYRALFYGYNCANYQAIYALSDNDDFDPSSVSSSGTTLSRKAQMLVEFGDVPSCLKPTGLTASLTPGNGTVAQLSWTENGNATQWQVCLNDDEDNLITANSNPFTLTGLTPDSTYTAKVRAVGNGEYSQWSNTVTFTPTNEYLFTVNDGTTANGYVPIYGYWADQLTASQFIIEAADLSVMEYGTINKLTFYSSDSSKSWGNATFDVYLGEVDQATFSSANFVDWSTLTKVYSGSASITDGKMEITLGDTYQYMGGNLLVGFNQTVTGSYSSVNWYGVTKTSASVGGYGSSFSVQNFLPKTTFIYEPGTLPTCFKPKDLAVVGEPAARSVQLQWTAGSTDQTAWDVAYKAAGDADFTIVEAVTSNPYTLTGLIPETEYTAKVRGNCGGGDVSEWCDPITFTTDVAFPAPENLKATEVKPNSAVISWGSNGAKRYNLRYKKADMSTMTTVILRTDDVWGDGTGYQMLLDANATAYDNVLPSSGPLTNSGDADASVYAEFEYKIPTNADGELTTSNIVLDESMSIVIPAGTYDWCITNPTPGDCLWIASAGGTIGGRADDYVFEPGKIYEFHVYHDSSTGNDATDLTITDDLDALAGSNEDWIVVNNVSSPYSLTGLDVTTVYVAQVQSVYEDGVSHWSSVSFVTPEENPVPFNVGVTTGTTSADISWEGFGDSYNVKYRKGEGYVKHFFEDFENGLTGWTVIRNGEGSNSSDWQAVSANKAHGGSTVAASFSWRDGSAYDVDNWLITPAVELKDTLRFWVKDDGSYHDYYAVYVSTGNDPSDTDAFTMVYEPGDASSDWSEVTVDLSSYNGDTGYIAIRHTDNNQNYLYIDDFGIYGAATAAGAWTTVNTTEKSLTVTGLEDGTSYEYQIQSLKGGETSGWTTLDTFITRAHKMPGDVNDDARISIADVTETVNLIKTHGYDAAADLDNDNDVDNDDLAKLVYVGVLGYSSVPGSGGGVLSAPRRQAPMSAPKAAIKPINFSVKKGPEEVKQQKLYRTK